MIDAWFLFAMVGYLAYAVSTTIDKSLMNHYYNPLLTNAVKMFFDGFLVLIGGLTIGYFFPSDLFIIDVPSDPDTWIAIFVLAFFYALIGVYYFKAVQLSSISKIIPYMQSSITLVTFLLALVLFHEQVSVLNVIGVVLIIVGIFFVLMRKKFGFPIITKGTVMITISIMANISYLLLAKKLVADITPLTLAILMYLCSSLMIFIYVHFHKRQEIALAHYFQKDKFKHILLTSLFGATGTASIMFALKLGDASRVYPMAGFNSVAVAIFGMLFFKEKLHFLRILGILYTFLGIYLVYV